jgi:glycerophosphoryl diester phosphodiesterase
MNKVMEWPRPLIIAHRGASANAPENTIAAFKLAVDHLADAVELDAMLSQDGEVIVFHDDTVNRTTDGQGYVKDLTFAALRKLDAGSSFSTDYANEPIPTLAEVFDAFGKSLYINIELKNYSSPLDRISEKVGDIIKEYAFQDRVLISSFNPLNLLKIKRILPTVPVALITMPGLLGTILKSPQFQFLSPQIIHPNFSDLNEKFIQKQHKSGRRVHAWTLNESKDLRRLISLNIDGIITDKPKLARKILEEE